MDIYNIELENLPSHIQEVILSEKFYEFLFSLHVKYNLTDEQDIAVLATIPKILAKTLKVEDLKVEITKNTRCNVATSDGLFKEIMINVVLPFRGYFNDYREYFKKAGGTEVDIAGSKVFPLVLKKLEDPLKKSLDQIVKVDYEKEALNIKHLFQVELVDYYFTADDNYKIALNGLIFDLLAQKENFHTELLNTMLENVQTIGEEKIKRDGVGYEPIVSEWIRDLHTFSTPDDVSSLTIAKYITQSPNARKLSDRDREALRRLFHTYYTLKNFPDSLAKTPQEQWMIIPYRAEDIPGGVFAPDYSTLEGLESEITPESFIGMPSAVSESSVVQELSSPQKRGFTIPLAPSTTEILASMPTLPDGRQAGVGMTEIIEPLPSMPTIIPSSTSMPSADYNAQAEDIIKKSGLAIADATLLNRLRSILATRLRNVRNDTQTKLRLMDPVSEGGVGLSKEQAETVLGGIFAAENPRGEVAENPTGSLANARDDVVGVAENPTGSLTIVRDDVVGAAENPTGFLATARNDVAKARDDARQITPPPLAIQEVDGVPTIVDQQPRHSEPSTKVNLGAVRGIPDDGVSESPTGSLTSVRDDVVGVSENPTGSLATARDDANKVRDDAKNARDDANKVRNGIKQIPIKIGPPSVGGKVSMSDVRTPPRLMDTVEELRSMTLKDFRRLSPKTEEATQKILQKFQLLEKESYTKKMAGIQAWKENEISKLYLQIGQESFGKGQSIGAVIDQRKAANQEYLTIEEFDTLLELNEQIRA